MRRVLLALAAIVVTPGLQAQELEPRAFSPGPTGLNIAAVAASYSSGDLVFDASVPIKDATARVKTGSLGYQRFFGLFGKTAKVAVLASWADANAAGDVGEVRRERYFNGLMDPRFAVSWIFAGAPAMAPAEYAKYRPRTLAGVSLSVAPPVGHYDPERLLNAGMNRWALRSQFGVSHYTGPWTLEGTLGAQFFTENDEYFGGVTQSQAPILSFQAHAAYTVRPQLWVAMGATYFRGGEATVNDIDQPGFQSNSRYGIAASIPVARGQSMGLNYSRGLVTKTGSNYDTIVLSWGVRWLDK